MEFIGERYIYPRASSGDSVTCTSPLPSERFANESFFCWRTLRIQPCTLIGWLGTLLFSASVIVAGTSFIRRLIVLKEGRR